MNERRNDLVLGEKQVNDGANAAAEQAVAARVLAMCARFPIYTGAQLGGGAHLQG